MGTTLHYVAAEKDPLYLHALRNRFLRTPNVYGARARSGRARPISTALDERFDTVLCLNVLEYLEDPVGTGLDRCGPV